VSLVVREAVVVPPYGDFEGPVDLRIEEGRIVAVGPTVGGGTADEVVDAGGRPALPGLHDHHVHLRALAAARSSVPAGPPDVADPTELGRRLRSAAALVPPGGWVRAVGYHESVAGDLDRWSLDRLCATRPVRVQHATGALWMLNSAAIGALGVDDTTPAGVERDDDGRPTGRVWREDGWLADRAPRVEGDLATISREAAARGVTGFTDATPGRGDLDEDGLVSAVSTGAVVQRLHLMADPVAQPLPEPLVTLGPVKVVLDDTALPSLDGLAATVTAAHRAGRPVAVHCVTRVQGVLAVAAIDQAGSMPGDRIEHGAVLGAGLLVHLRRLGLVVVTQPGMAMARGDRYLDDVEPDEVADLWRAASLEAAGVEIAAGTDAPYGPADPWSSLEAATSRRTPSGFLLGGNERLGPARALRLFTGWADRPAHVRTLRPGEPADLCVLTGPPGDLGRSPGVLATIVAGRVVHRSAGG
jgi:predicted amidohydrolase YtcJ